MPELDGIGVVRMLKKGAVPLVAFVTAYDEYAIKAFEMNAVDCLLKPVEKKRLRDTVNRAHERVEHAEIVAEQAHHVDTAIAAYESAVKPPFVERIPVRRRDEVLIVPVHQVASIVAEGELLHLTTATGDRHTINHRLKDQTTREHAAGGTAARDRVADRGCGYGRVDASAPGHASLLTVCAALKVRASLSAETISVTPVSVRAFQTTSRSHESAECARDPEGQTHKDDDFREEADALPHKLEAVRGIKLIPAASTLPRRQRHARQHGSGRRRTESDRSARSPWPYRDFRRESGIRNAARTSSRRKRAPASA